MDRRIDGREGTFSDVRLNAGVIREATPVGAVDVGEDASV